MGERDGSSGSLELGEGSRLLLPVMAAAGGSGRSTVAGLLACGLAESGRAAVLDTSPRLASPWPAWTAGQDASGLASLPPDRPLARGQVQRASATCAAPRGANWQVLTDGRDWHSPPLALPQDPAAWYQLAAVGGWQAVIADTTHPVAHDILVARCEGRLGQTRGWCDLPYAVPVLCGAATASGLHALQQTAMAMQAEGLPLQRTVVVLVATANGRPPALVRAGATMLASRTAAVVHLPHDPDIRAHGLRRTARLNSRTRQTARRLADAVLAAAHVTWGEPLPGAPVPVPVPVAVPVL